MKLPFSRSVRFLSRIWFAAERRTTKDKRSHRGGWELSSERRWPEEEEEEEEAESGVVRDSQVQPRRYRDTNTPYATISRVIYFRAGFASGLAVPLFLSAYSQSPPSQPLSLSLLFPYPSSTFSRLYFSSTATRFSSLSFSTSFDFPFFRGFHAQSGGARLHQSTVERATANCAGHNILINRVWGVGIN